MIDGEFVDTLHQLERVAGAEFVRYKHPATRRSDADHCLCPVDIEATMAAAGFSRDQAAEPDVFLHSTWCRVPL